MQECWDVGIRLFKYVAMNESRYAGMPVSRTQVCSSVDRDGYMCMHVCKEACFYGVESFCIHLYVYMYVCVGVCVHVHMYGCMHTCMSMSVSVSGFVSVSISVYECVCVCVCLLLFLCLRQRSCL